MMEEKRRMYDLGCSSRRSLQSDEANGASKDSALLLLFIMDSIDRGSLLRH